MVTAETHVDRREGVTLVRTVVNNPHATAQAVRLRIDVDGPIWPPREETGVVSNWDGSDWTATLDPGERRGVGLATPAVVDDPDGVADVTATARISRSETLADGVLGDLDPWAPPRAVLADGVER